MCAALLFAVAPSTASALQVLRLDLGAATDSRIAIYQVRLDLIDEQTDGVRKIILAQGEKAQEMFEVSGGQGARPRGGCAPGWKSCGTRPPSSSRPC